MTLETENNAIDRKKWIGTTEEFEAFLANYDTPTFRKTVMEKFEGDESAVTEALTVYFSEMRFGYKFVMLHLPAGRQRILEVGAGLGLVSIFLSTKGHDVTALEPGAPSFGIFEATKSVVWNNSNIPFPRLIERGAETLNSTEDGSFDFIFSVNVMEHISELEQAVAGVLSVLTPNGIWANTCPNYIFPYEPHYSIPIIPLAPGLSRYFFAKTIDKNPSVWDTLNFITSFDIKRMAKKHNASVTLQSNTIYDSLKRLGEDASFAQRHKAGVAMKAYRFLSAAGLLGLLKLAPASLVTPMVFTFRHIDGK